MFSRADHEALVTQLYSSAAGDQPWAPTLAALSSYFGIAANVLNIADTAWRTIAVETHGATVDKAIDYYASEIYANDPRTPHLHGRPGTIYFDHMLYDMAEIERDPWFQEAVRAIGVKYQLGARLRLPEGLIGAFAVLPTEQEGHASEAAIAAFRRMAPHIEQAVAMGVVVDREAATSSALLDALSRKAEGVILLNGLAMPTFMNGAAQAILAAHDGLEFSGGAFVTRRLPETRRIQQLVRGALAGRDAAGSTPGGRLLITRPSGRRPYVMSVMAAPPLERFLAGHSIAGIVHLQDLAAIRLPSREALQAVFGLSEREADFAIELVRCTHLEAAAAHAGMATNTARNHLQSISRKTGARGQVELVQLLGALD